MALTSKKIARALFALSEDQTDTSSEGYSSEELADAFIKYASSSNILYMVPNVIRHLELLNKRKAEEKKLIISTVFPISEEMKKEIRRFLDVKPGADSTVKVDKSLIGGFIARYNNAVYDASLKNQISTLKKKLTK